MADSKDRFRRIVAQRNRQGLHYMTLEKYKAQMEFMKSVSDSATVKVDEVSSTDDRANKQSG